MVDRIPRPEEAGGAVWSHDWHPYEDYKTVHYRHMTNLINEGLVQADGLTFHEYLDDSGRLAQVNIEGRIDCAGGLAIRVDKWLEADSFRNVRGYSYSYHAWLSDPEQLVIRYDNAHQFNNLHCHIPNPTSGAVSRYPVPIDSLPTLDGFIRNAIKMVQDAKEEV